jgi:hypothetical protein
LTQVEPADHRREEHSEGERIDHGRRVYTTDPISGLKDPWPSDETLRLRRAVRQEHLRRPRGPRVRV